MDQLSIASADYCGMRISLWLLPPNFARLRQASTKFAGMVDANSTTRLQSDKLSFARVQCLCWSNGKVLSRIDRELAVSQREAWGA
jgi:hypothetical protein